MINKQDILQNCADILRYEHDLITSTLPPLIADEYTVKGVNIPLVHTPQHDTGTLNSINEAIALHYVQTDKEALSKHYAALCLECREHRLEEEYQELIEELVSTFEEAYSLIFEDLKHE
ncbi:hypothetical protein [Vibrio diazotrophicus]|uniref:hypothetical protein n=1 Tax=Vibrio diazotrophicus TaxID=685 RepID=UPI00142E448F|nr:hypothetical protein [Vibrio diazotrophicus]NIY91980.1 hypothetical protein [Vibrio diazotrophicus]